MLAGLARALLVLLTLSILSFNNIAAQQVQISISEGFEAPAAAPFAPAPAPSESASAAASAPGLGDEHPATDYPSSTTRNGQQLQLRVHAYRNFQPHIYPGAYADDSTLSNLRLAPCLQQRDDRDDHPLQIFCRVQIFHSILVLQHQADHKRKAQPHGTMPHRPNC